MFRVYLLYVGLKQFLRPHRLNAAVHSVADISMAPGQLLKTEILVRFFNKQTVGVLLFPPHPAERQLHLQNLNAVF